MRPDSDLPGSVETSQGGDTADVAVSIDLTVLDAKSAGAVADAERRLQKRFSIGAPPAVGEHREQGVSVDTTPAAKRLRGDGTTDTAVGVRSSGVERTPVAGDLRGARFEDSAKRLIRVNSNLAATPSCQTKPLTFEDARTPTAAESARARALVRAESNTLVTSHGETRDEKTRLLPKVNDDASGNGNEAVDVAARLLTKLAAKPQAVDVTWLPGRVGNLSDPVGGGFKVNPAVLLTLKEAGIGELYSHQKRSAAEVLKNGGSVVVATPTASGKSLCYLVPLLTRLSERKSSRAVLLFPLKALANDQLLKVQQLTKAAGRLAESGSFDGDKKTLHRLRAISKITSATCDGDSSDAQRARIKTEKTQIVLTNPDSLHHRILPGYPKKWTSSFWHNLEFLVLDEAHVLRGVGGSHVGNVLRRVLRVCRECGNENLKFIATSATIGNPGEHVFKLTTVDPVVITESGAPSGPKAMVLWQPPALKQKGHGHDAQNAGPEPSGVEKRNSGGSFDDSFDDPLMDSDSRFQESDGTAPIARKSAYREAAEVIATLVRAGISCLCFVTARALTESVVRDVKHLLVKSGDQGLALRVDSYRAGYDQAERRNLERRLQHGELTALVTTSALEAGIDVGVLDATVHVGVPDTASGMWQQAGRAGRRGGSSVAIVVACERPLDSYFLTRPKELWARAPENATCDPTNTAILEQHLPCAAYESSIDVAKDARVFDDLVSARRMREGGNVGVGHQNPQSVSVGTKTDVAAGTATDGAPKPAVFQTPFLLALRRGLSATRREDDDNKTTDSSWNDGTPLLTMNKTTKRVECRQFFRPHIGVSLRGAKRDGPDWVVLDVTNGNSLRHGAVEIEKVNAHGAAKRIYPGCLFSCRRGVFKIQKLIAEDRVALCVLVTETSQNKTHTTSPLVRVTVTPLYPDPKTGVPPRRSKLVGNARVAVSSGRATVTEQVLGCALECRWRKLLLHKHEYETPLACTKYATDAVWWEYPLDVIHKIPPDRLKESAAGVLNLLISLVPSAAACDARDIGGCVFWKREAGVDAETAAGDGNEGLLNPVPNDGCHEITVGLCLFDATPDGVGLVTAAFDKLGEVWEKALTLVRTCACEKGCPGCVNAGGRQHQETDKKYARIALEGITGAWMT